MSVANTIVRFVAHACPCLSTSRPCACALCSGTTGLGNDCHKLGIIQQCRELESEKEAVRYFWRNEVIEGQTRRAVMLRKSLQN